MGPMRRAEWGVLAGMGAVGGAGLLVLAQACSAGVEMPTSSQPVTHAAEALPALTDAGDAMAAEGRRRIAESRAAYAACKTYEDVGTYENVFRGGAEQRDAIDFHTVFAGPRAVRFAYRERAGRFQPESFTELVADASGVRTRLFENHAPQHQDSLLDGVWALQGVSRKLSAAIIPLLPSGVKHWNVLAFTGARLTGQDEVDGKSCDVVEGLMNDGVQPGGPHVQVWIAQSDSLVRRVVEDWVQNDAEMVESATDMAKHLPDLEAIMRDAGRSDAEIAESLASLSRPRERLSTFSTTTYHPKCNQPIAPESLLSHPNSL